MENALDNYEYTPLYCAAGAGHAEMVKILLENGAKIGATSKDGSTSLIVAARKGCVQVTSILPEKEASADKDTMTLLLLAANYFHVKIVKMLLEKVANKQTLIPKSWTPLGSSKRQAHAEISKLLSEEQYES